MIKATAYLAIVFGTVFAQASFAWAQMTPREQCCVQMGGQYRVDYRNRGDQKYCMGMRGRADAYYKCVEQKMSGKR